METLIKRFLQRFTAQEADTPVIIVSGLPRSGTSMMMKILEGGGLPVLTDNIRTADGDNPKGYYEFERVKKLPKGDIAWLAEARGKVVKVLAILLFKLPEGYNYRVVFMRRAMPEILASQRKMLINRGEDPDRISDEELAVLFERYYQQAKSWMEQQPHVESIEIDYNLLLQDPQPQIEAINRFFDKKLDVNAMLKVVDPQLYRQRR
ncbi:MAG: sulfotransferase domain-containing protein [Anaerolineae bacterium]|nr:sulfotransferase domain-containing protein [Anaerolineae bacterium]